MKGRVPADRCGDLRTIPGVGKRIETVMQALGIRCVADLRGKDDVERARCIIEHCAGPHYREPLRVYLEKAVREAGGHHPQLLREAFAWHIRLQETGSMLE